MYTLTFIILAGISIFFLYKGFQAEQKKKLWIGAVLGLFTISLSGLMNFWGELLWFQAVGYGERFWIATLTQWGMALLSLLLGAGLIWLLSWQVSYQNRYIKRLGIAIGGLIGMVWGYANWEIFLKFWFGVETGITDPILGRDTGFYLFSLPFLNNLHSVLTTFAILSIAISLLSIFVNRSGQTTLDSRPSQ